MVLVGWPCLTAQATVTGGEWSGHWDSRWRNGGAGIDLIQDGDRVTGVYSLYDGRIEATASPGRLRGHWIEGPRTGAFTFFMAPDGQSFAGSFDNGEWWTGGRAEAIPRPLPIDQSGVREALRTFVEGGNLAQDGELDQLAASTAVLDFGDRNGMAQGEKVALARRLYSLIDMTTFQLWSFPGKRAKGPRYDLRLQQAGTGATLPLTFSQSSDGKWRIVAPTEAQLDSASKDLLQRSGGRPPDPTAYLRLRSPRDTMTAFLRASTDQDEAGHGRILETLDTSELFGATRNYEGLLAAQYLRLVLSRVNNNVPQAIPNDPADRQPFIVFTHPVGNIVIAPEGEGDRTVWKFTPETIRTIRALYAAVEPMPISDAQLSQTPSSPFFAVRAWLHAEAPSLTRPWGPVEEWQVLGAFVGVAACLLVAMVLAQIVMLLVRWESGFRDLTSERALRWPFRLALTGLLFKLLIPPLGWPEEVRRFSAPIHAVIIAGFGVWAGWYLIDVILARARRTARGLDDITVSLCIGLLRIAMICVAGGYVAAELSIPTGGLLAGLGLSGLAIAFASRETLSNIFGAAVLVADKPFKRGDWIVAGEVQGTIEHVGIRSTRIRSIEDTVSVVPNGRLADASINNWGSRRHRLLHVKLAVSYGAGPAHLNAFIEALYSLLSTDGTMAAGRTHVSILNLGERSIDLEVMGYLNVVSVDEEKAARSRLLIDILSLAERMGILIGSMSPHAKESAA